MVYTLSFLFAQMTSVSLSTASAPGDTLWTRVYGGVYNESAFSVQPTRDAGYILTGYSYTYGPGNYDVYLLKTDADGDTLWTRTFGGTDSDYGTCVRQTDDGGYIIAGYTSSFGPGTSAGYLIRTDANADSLWTKTFGGEGYELLHDMCFTDDGGYVLTGRSTSFGDENSDLYLVKTDSEGNHQWTRAYGGEEWDEGYCVHQTADRGFIIVGNTESFNPGARNIWLMKTDAGGDTLWTRTFGGALELEARSIQKTGDGGYIIGGYTDPWGGTADVLLLKTDMEGKPEWAHLYGWDNDQMANSVQQTPDGGYIFAGYAWKGGDNWYDVYAGKTDEKGNLQWQNTYGGSKDEHGQSLALTSDGNYIIAGDTRSYGEGAGDFYLLKIAAAPPFPEVTIEVFPDSVPLIVPRGDSFGFTGILVNDSNEAVVVDVWSMVAGPFRRTFGPLKLFLNVTLAPDDTLFGHLREAVPDWAPLGFYDYIAYCGEYPEAVYDSSLFRGEVVQE
jgi:hypothetical protein